MKSLKNLWLSRSSKDEKNRPTRATSFSDPPGNSRSSSSSSLASAGSDASDIEPFRMRNNSVATTAPSFFSDTVEVEVKDKEKGKEKEDRKEKRDKGEKDKDRKDKDKKDGKSKSREHDRSRAGRPKPKYGEVDEDELKLDSDKGDFDPEDDVGRETVYVENLKDLPEEAHRSMKRSKIPEEKFEQFFDVLLRVMTFTNKSKKIYRSTAWPSPPARVKPNTIFVSPGKYFKYPEEQDVAIAKLCYQDDPKLHIKFGEFEGRGGFGRVFAGRIKDPHNASEKHRVAVKVMPHKTEKEIRMNFNEVGLVSYFNHPNVVKFRRCYLYNDELWLIMEFLEGGTLKEATHNFQFAEPHIAYVAKEMLKGIAYLHQNHVAHRDLKSANVMLSMKAEVKLIDFGLCADFTEKSTDTHMCGSPFWMPPEMITQQPHGLSCDIWSFGVCLVEMMNRKVPHNRSIFKAMFIAGSEGFKFGKEEHKWSAEFHDLIEKCLQVNPAARPTASELLLHPFMRKAASVRQMEAIMPALFLSNTMIRQGLL